MALAIDHTDTYSPMMEAWRMVVRNKAAVMGLILFLIVLLITFVGPYLYEVDPFKIVWGSVKNQFFTGVSSRYSKCNLASRATPITALATDF